MHICLIWHFHVPPAIHSWSLGIHGSFSDSMKRKELDGVILRWKKTTRALRIHEQVYGKYITDLLEKRTDAELALFSDPVEAAAFFCLLDLVEKVSDLPPVVSVRPVGEQSLAVWQ